MRPARLALALSLACACTALTGLATLAQEPPADEHPERRGGVLVAAGRRILDNTLPARLERAWPDLEAELAALLEEG